MHENEFAACDPALLEDESMTILMVDGPEPPPQALPTQPFASRRPESSARRILELAMYTFGDLHIAEEWMRQRHDRLRASPNQLCERPGGEPKVMQLLHAITNGTET